MHVSCASPETCPRTSSCRPTGATKRTLYLGSKLASALYSVCVEDVGQINELVPCEQFLFMDVKLVQDVQFGLTHFRSAESRRVVQCVFRCDISGAQEALMIKSTFSRPVLGRRRQGKLLNTAMLTDETQCWLPGFTNPLFVCWYIVCAWSFINANTYESD